MLFPDCNFELNLSKPSIRTGERISAEVVLETREAIPNAKVLYLAYKATATAGYGSGKSRRVYEETIYREEWPFRLREGLPAGRTKFPFDLELPPGLPPSYRGDDCGIEHLFTARLDVPWAVDPQARDVLIVSQRPRKGPMTPFVSRTTATFHPSLVVEVSLDSSVVSQDMPLRGQIAVRGADDVAFDAVKLTAIEQATITMARKDARNQRQLAVRIEADALRGGEPVPFLFPAGSLRARFKSGYIELANFLALELEIPWRADPIMYFPIKVMPPRSKLYGEGVNVEVGNPRMRRLADALAKRSGLERSTGAELVKGRFGFVEVALVEVTRRAKLGIDVRLAYPSLGLGTAFKPMGALDGFRRAELTPAFLANTHVLRSSPDDHVPRYDDADLAPFYARVLAPMEGASDLRFHDRGLSAWFEIADEDEYGSAVRAADGALRLADEIRAAVDALPFPAALREHEEAWRAFARRESGVGLVPSGPTLTGLAVGRRVSNGDQRVLEATIRTAWSQNGPFTRIAVSFDSDGLRGAKARLEDFVAETASERVEAVHATFPRVEVDEAGALLESDAFIADPQALVAALERFLEWYIDARGERLADAPYR